ncbi:FecCD family ABC transporter permease [Corticicoccus populi]|uniref:FecCD family ABC transporter permease n=1 Tax=Corticicoccus populi TaxID=1812821 RepID=A0ABW5WW32_9STAP
MIHPKLLRLQRIVFFSFLIILFLTIAWNITTGDYKMSAGTFFKTLFGGGDARDQLILMEFRMPRMIVAALTGMALSMSGAVLQSVSKNPLADPGILGINAGGGFAVTVFIAFGTVNPAHFIYVIPVVSVIGGLLAALLIFMFSYSKGKGITPASMVLIGIGLAGGLSGASILIMRSLRPDQIEFIANWQAGTIWGDQWEFVYALLPWLIIIVPVIFMKSNVLNIINTDDLTARNLGINLNRERIVLLTLAVLLSSAAVSVAGGIGFIGLMGPHIARSIVGPRHQLYMPVALLAGAVLLVTADTLGQIAVETGTIPAGIVVAIIGAPYFLYLMFKNKRI